MFVLQDSALLKQQCLVDGDWVSATNGQTLAVTNPANQQPVAHVPALDKAQAQEAIDAAERALPAWRSETAKNRGRLLQRWYQLIIDNIDDLAALMTAEQGKPLAEARGEVGYAAAFIEWFAEEGKRTYGEVIPSPDAKNRLMVIKQPVGVCAAITPWNFPAAMITRKVAPALAAGCTIIVKPSDLTPLTALALGELAQRAGIPAGVLQIITGEAATLGDVLTRSPVVRKLSFTGSTAVGHLLMAQSAPTLKRLSLELGGNAPFIVFDDADLEAAVDGAIAAKFRNAGQTCVCANRFLIQDAIYPRFAALLTERVNALRVGAGDEKGVTIGPLIDQRAIAKVQQHISDACEHGATVLTGGHLHAQGGNFFQPTVLSEVTATMRIAKEETFGPVAPLFRFHTEEEAVAMANDTEFGLAAYFYTRDSGRGWRVAEALEYGMVGHNTGLISNEVAPFGGIKYSGLGREGSHHGIDEYLELKYICAAIQ